MVAKPIKVECGDAHSLCLLDNGQVLSWGHGIYGQVSKRKSFIVVFYFK